MPHSGFFIPSHTHQRGDWRGSHQDKLQSRRTGSQRPWRSYRACEQWIERRPVRWLDVEQMLYCIPVEGSYLTMNGQWVSIRMRPSLRMCSRWPLARSSRFLRTRIAKRGLAPLFSCTWRRWRSIDRITETWNLVAAAREWRSVAREQLSDEAPYQVDVTKLPDRQGANDLEIIQPGGREKVRILVWSARKENQRSASSQRWESDVIICWNTAAALLTRSWILGSAALPARSRIQIRQLCLWRPWKAKILTESWMSVCNYNIYYM